MTDFDTEKNPKFETLLDIVNHEIKALVFLTLTEKYITVMDISDNINNNYNLIKPIKENLIYSHISKVLGKGNRDLIEETKVEGRLRHSVKAWALTKKGIELQPFVAFLMSFLPLNYSLSAYSVIGAMNSNTEKRASYAHYNILRALEEYPELSLEQLSKITKLRMPKTQRRLDYLHQIENIKRETISFVEPARGDKSVQDNVYLWTGKPLNIQDFGRNSRITKLVEIFTKAGTDAYFYALDLYKKVKYANFSNMFMALSVLEERGYIRSFVPSHFRKYKITEEGRDYVKYCLKPAYNALLGDQLHLEYVMKSQPLKTELAKAANVKLLSN